MTKTYFVAFVAFFSSAYASPTGSFYFRHFTDQNSHGFTPTIGVMSTNYQIHADLKTQLDVVYDPLETAQLGAPPQIQVTLTSNVPSTNCGLSGSHTQPYATTYTTTPFTFSTYSARPFANNPAFDPFSLGPGYWDPSTTGPDYAPNYVLLWCELPEPGTVWTITAAVINGVSVVDGTNLNPLGYPTTVAGATYPTYSQTFVVGAFPTLTITKISSGALTPGTDSWFNLHFSPATENIDTQLTMEIQDPSGQAVTGCTIGRYYQPQQHASGGTPQIIYFGNPATAYGYTQPSNGIWPSGGTIPLQADQTDNLIFVKCAATTSCPLTLTSTGQPHGKGPEFKTIVDSPAFTVGTSGPTCPPTPAVPILAVPLRPELTPATSPPTPSPTASTTYPSKSEIQSVRSPATAATTEAPVAGAVEAVNLSGGLVFDPIALIQFGMPLLLAKFLTWLY